MTTDRTFKALVVGELPEIDHIFSWDRFQQRYPCEKVTVQDPEAFPETVADPEIDVILVDGTPFGGEVLDLVLEERPIRPTIMVADRDQADLVLEAKDRGLDAYVLRVGDENLDTRMLARKLEGVLDGISRPPSLEQPTVDALFEYAQYFNTRQPFFVIGRERRILYINAAGRDLVERLHGRRPRVGARIEDFPLEKSTDRFDRHLAAAFDGETVDIEHLYRDVPESQGHRRLSYDPVIDPGERVVAVSITAQNIGPRVEAEAKYERFEEILWHHFEESPLPLKVIGSDGIIERCNAAYRDLLGYESVADIEGKSIAEVHHPEDIQRGREALERLLAGEDEYARIELREQRPDGTVVWTDHVGFVLPSMSPTEREVFVISVDVTRQKEAEQRMERSMRMQALGELAGGVAHDFNNVLSVVGTVGHLLERKLEADGHEEYLDLLDRIERAVDSGTSLTQQLMAFGRERPTEEAVADLNAEIEEVGRLLERTIGEHVELQFDLEEDVPPVASDSGRLQQVVMNLAVNARDAIREEGTLEIGTETVTFAADDETPHPTVEPGEYAILRVVDDGIGMDEETLDHIFDPFFTTKTAQQGTGLGLATVYKIVDDAGGQIQVDSEPGEGTTFEIYLPVASEEGRPSAGGETSDDESVAEPEPAANPGDGGPGRILLVEDENDLREPYKLYLEREGHEVVSAGSYREARSRYDEYHGEIDLIVADVVLPDGSGVDLVEELREIEPDIEVVYVSGYAPDLVVEREASSNHWEYLRKPVGGDQLVATVGEAMAGR